MVTTGHQGMAPQGPGEMKMTTIGEIEIEINHVTHVRTAKEDGGSWLTGTASVTWSGMVGGITHDHTVDVSIGCWDDTDDDNAEWAAWHEGARVIERCLGGTGTGDMRGTAVQMAFRAEARSLGDDLCRLLRDASTADDHCAVAD
jgi:hypothetical protein